MEREGVRHPNYTSYWPKAESVDKLMTTSASSHLAQSEPDSSLCDPKIHQGILNYLWKAFSFAQNNDQLDLGNRKEDNKYNPWLYGLQTG